MIMVLVPVRRVCVFRAVRVCTLPVEVSVVTEKIQLDMCGWRN